MKEVFIKTLSMGIVLCILTACTGRPSPSTYSNSSATSSDSNVEADNKNTEPTATGFKKSYAPLLFCFGLWRRERRTHKSDSVITENIYSSYELTNYLIQQGHTDIGFVGTVGSTTSISDRYLGYLRRMLAYFPSFQVIIFYLSIAPMVEKRESSHFLELMPHLWMEATVKHLLHLTMGNVLAMCFVPTENPLSAH